MLVEEILHAQAALIGALRDDLHQIVDRAGFGKHVKRNVDIEVILDLHNEIHHRDEVDFKAAHDL